MKQSRYTKVNLKKTSIINPKIRKKNLLNENEEKIDKFVDLWARLKEDETTTLSKKLMIDNVEKIKEKTTEVKEFEIIEKVLYETLKKDWSAQGVNGRTNGW